MTLTNHVTAGCLVYRKVSDQIEFLLIFRKWNYKTDGAWILPKGHIEDCESPEQSAIRETVEETGYSDIEIVDFLKEVDIQYNFEGETHQKKIYWYLAKLNSNDTVKTMLTENESSSEVFELHWIKQTELLDLLTFDSEKEPARLALEKLGIN